MALRLSCLYMQVNIGHYILLLISFYVQFLAFRHSEETCSFECFGCAQFCGMPIKIFT